MTWQPLNQLILTDEWQYTDPTDGELFKIRHSNLGSVARAMIAQAAIIDDEIYLFQIKEISANQNEILQIVKPVAFTERRLAFCQIYGESNWTIYLDEFMPTSNPGGNASIVTYTASTNTKASLTAATSGTVLAANSNRKYAHFENNTSYDITLSIGVTPAVAGQGIILKGNGGTHEMIAGLNLTTQAIYGICTAAVDIAVVEGT